MFSCPFFNGFRSGPLRLATVVLSAALFVIGLAGCGPTPPLKIGFIG